MRSLALVVSQVQISDVGKLAMRKPAFAIALLAGHCPQQSVRAQAWITVETSPNITPVYHKIFYEAPGPWLDLPIRLDLSKGEMKELIPPRSGKFAMVGMTCSGISRDRHLEGCKIDVEPKSVGYEALGSELAARVLVDPAFSADTKSAVKFISLQFRVVNSDTGDVAGPCWPPSCVREPAPPPPAPTKVNGRF